MSGRGRDVGRILRDRARLLASREDTTASSTVALATFTIGGHKIGVPLDRVTRAAEMRYLTEIPGGPPYLVGITAVEGHLVSLLDITAFLNLERHGVGDITGSLVVSWGDRELGLAAEALLGIEDVPANAIHTMPGAVGPVARMARVGELELLLLDVEVLFADPRLGRERAING